MSVPNSRHKVYIYRNDYNLLCTDVYLHQNVATGGNLFGLWKNFGSAVIHVLLGPGQHCKRTGASFQQDVEYMKRVDRFLDDRYSLCHIGEWRSHHSLSLNKPSTEDVHHIRRIFPKGMSFLFIIANIKNGDTIMLSPYFCCLLTSAPKPRPRRSDALVNLTQSKVEPNWRPISNTNDGIRYRPRDYCESCPSHPLASQHATSAEGQDDPKKKMNVDEGTPSKPEIKKIHDHLKYWYGCQTESMFKFENFMKSRNTLEISFKHNKNFWVVCFPKEFPDEPAGLFCSVYQQSVRVTKVSRIDIVGPLDNVVNILMSIKSRCGSISGRCNACRNFTRESLPKFIQNIGSSGEHFSNSASELVKDIEKSLTGVDDLAMKCGSESQAQITFKYKTRYWVIELPANYPEIAAKVYYFAYEGSSQKREVLLHGEHSYGAQKLDSSELIIKAIAVTL